MMEPHSHRGEPRDEEHDEDREPHTPAHVAVTDEAEEQPV